ncbi:MAG: methylmalonyl-CoA epimerase [Chloroflexota bacterium]
MMIKKISHIAIVVPELEQALGFWVEALGLRVQHIEHVPDQGVDVAFIRIGDSDVELLQPRDESSGVARYLHKRGPGIHHICFEVDNIEEVLTRLKATNVPLIDERPTIGTGGKKIAFIHPKGTNGVLVELYELTAEEPLRRWERLNDMRRRLRQEGRAYTAAIVGFLAGLRAGGNGNGQSE